MAEGALDLTKISRKLWLVKVPNSIAQIWRPLCEKAMNSTVVDDDESQDVALGMIRLEQSAAKQAAPSQPSQGPSQGFDITMFVNGGGPQLGSTAPRIYSLEHVASNPDMKMAAFTYRQDKDGEAPTQLRAEGVVDFTFNAKPTAVTDGKGGVLVDDDYRRLNRARTVNASTRTRVVQRMEETREEKLQLLAAERRQAAEVKRKAEEARRRAPEVKRVRKEASELEAELFRLFEHTPHWTFPQLLAETKQPGQHLKEVLNTIAIQNKRGPLRDMYELKKEYKLGGQGGEQGAA